MPFMRLNYLKLEAEELATQINKAKSGQKLPSNKDAVKPTTVVVTNVRVLNHRYDKL